MPSIRIALPKTCSIPLTTCLVIPHDLCRTSSRPILTLYTTHLHSFKVGSEELLDRSSETAGSVVRRFNIGHEGFYVELPKAQTTVEKDDKALKIVLYQGFLGAFVSDVQADEAIPLTKIPVR